MKLRNKKTGEIGKLLKLQDDDDLEVMTDDKCYRYKTIAEVVEHFEDYEEPKEFWFIDADGEVEEATYLTEDDKSNLKNFGNYFETKEEAEEVVEKLKAWKRLKDNGLRFEGLTLSSWGCSCIEYKVDGGISDSSSDMQVRDDLYLLFGGKE